MLPTELGPHKTEKKSDVSDMLRQIPLTAFTAVGSLRALIDSTLSNARRFYLSMGNCSTVKGLMDTLKLIKSPSGNLISLLK